MTLRRLYLYLVSAAGLALLAAGLSLLGATVLLFVFNDNSAQYSRTQLAGFTAMTLVALPVWGVHFWFAQRFAKRDRQERASAIRRLYLYWACLVMSIAAMVALALAISGLLRPVLDNQTLNGLTTAQEGWAALVFVAIWAFHFRIATSDRAAVGEEGASATLRRWYMYIALLVGVLVMLSGTSTLLQNAWTRLVLGSPPQNLYLADPAGQALAGLLLWGFHARTIAQHHVSDDRHSTLRATEGFIVVGVGIVTALVGASQILYYGLARALDVSSPGRVTNDLLAAVAMPGSLLLVYGVAWILERRRLARDAGTQEADRQAGMRRLYTNLASLVSLGAAAIGAGGLLWTLAEQIEAPLIGVNAADWKDPVSLWATLLVVGAVVWLTHWRHAPWAADRQSLSRRLYVWAALLASVLVLVGAGVGMVYALLSQLFSANPKLNDSANLGFGHYLAVIVVAVIVGVYHWRVLRADAAARPPKPEAAPAPAPAPAPAIAAVTTTPTPAPAPAVEIPDDHSRRYVLSVTDATEDDVHTALANLPPHASYKLTPSEQAS